MLQIAIAAAIVVILPVNANVDLRWVTVVRPNNDTIRLNHFTGYSTFIDRFNIAVFSRVKNAISNNLCHIRNGTDERSVLKKMDANKYAIFQLIGALSAGDHAYTSILVDVLKTYATLSSKSWANWIYDSFNFSPRQMYKVLNNTVNSHNVLNVSYPPCLLNFVSDLAAKYFLFEIAVNESDYSVIRWLADNGYDFSTVKSNVIKSLWNKDQQDLLKQLLQTRNRKTIIDLNVILKTAFKDNYSFIEFLVQHEIIDSIDIFLSMNVTDICTILSLALGFNKSFLVDKYEHEIGYGSCNSSSRTTLLHFSVKNGKIGIIKQLLDMHVDVNAPDRNGFTPLYSALVARDELVFKALLKKGAKVNSTTSFGKTLLSLSVSENRTDMVSRLLEIGVDTLQPDIDGTTPLQIAIANGNTEIIDLLVQKIQILSNLTFDGGTPLHFAVTNGTASAIKTLIDLGLPVDSADIEGNTPLKAATILNDTTKILLLVEHDATVSIKDIEGNTPLHVAVAGSSLSVVRVLTVLGADINSTNILGHTPLFIAVKNNNPNVIVYLIRKQSTLTFNSTNGDTLLHVAAHYGSKEAMITLINHGLLINATNIENETSLIVAVKNNKPSIINLLAAKGDDIFQATIHGDTLLHLSVDYEHIEAMKALLILGLDQKTPNDAGVSSIARAILKNKYILVTTMLSNSRFVLPFDSSQFILAASNGCIESLRALMDIWKSYGFNVHKPNQKQQTALSEAVRANQTPTVSFLIKQGADINYKTRSGDTLVHIAAMNGSKDSLEILIGLGLGVNSTNLYGDSPLWLASKFGHLETMILLHEKGANINFRSMRGPWENGSLLIPAAFSGNEKAVLWLLSKGLYIDDKDILGETALLIAASEGHTNVVRTLLDKGADVDGADLNGWTPLHKAAYNGYLEAADTIIQYGAELNLRAVSDLTPLHQASSNGHVEIVSLLLNSGSEKDPQDVQGWTPLHWAAYKGHKEVVKELLDKGANKNMKSKDGFTPLRFANERNHLAISNLITEFGGKL